jgi:hypothetical protein
MSESKFTPGPWKMLGRWNDRYLAVIDSIPDRNGKVVANCICHVALTNEDAKANANLIAAAPELLAACEAFLDMWHRAGPEGSHQFEKFDGVVRMASMAIENAKSEE